MELTRSVPQICGQLLWCNSLSEVMTTSHVSGWRWRSVRGRRTYMDWEHSKGEVEKEKDRSRVICKDKQSCPLSSFVLENLHLSTCWASHTHTLTHTQTHTHTAVASGKVWERVRFCSYHVNQCVSVCCRTLDWLTNRSVTRNDVKRDKRAAVFHGFKVIGTPFTGKNGWHLCS